MVRLLPLLLLAGCLEKVTGEDVPLDPRYTAGHENDGKAPQPDGGGGGGGQPGAECDPYADYKGETVKVTGAITGDDPLQVQIDVFVPDPAAPGGQTRTGCLRVPKPGPFEFKVPADLTSVALQAFQDPDGNGPSEKDPFGAAKVTISDAAPEFVTIPLVAGARGQPSGPGAPPPGGDPNAAGGAPAPPGAPGGGATAAVFPDGPMVTLSGTVTAALPGDVSIDFFKDDPASPGGRTFLFKHQARQGAWSAKFPKDYGPIDIDAYQDPGGDGPSAGDPMLHYEKNPVTIGSGDVSGVDLSIL